MKLQNNCKEEKLVNWLRTGYSVDCIKVLQRKKSKSRRESRRYEREHRS